LYGTFDFFQEFLRFFAKKSGFLALKTAIFNSFFKSVGFPTLSSHPAKSYNKGVVLMWFRILVVFWAAGPLQSALAGNYSKNPQNFEKISEILKKSETNGQLTCPYIVALHQ
jgi:hypothetical protein